MTATDIHTTPQSSQAPQITEAIRLYRAGKPQESRDRLRDFLLQYTTALLWLARVSPDSQEAVAAAELALKLDPSNEIAQRAVIAVRERVQDVVEPAPERAQLSAAVGLSTGMTLAEARTVRWHFKKISRPIGEALDEGLITVRDLAWAAEQAYDARIRDAAKTILLTHWLDAEPTEMPRPLKVVTASRYSEKQERRSIALGALGAGALLTLSGFLLLAGLAPLVALVFGWDWPGWAAWAVIPAGAFVLMMWQQIERYADEAEQYRLGRWGEEQVSELLRASLDSRWTLFRNVEWPDRNWGDLDMVLVGPGGVWLLEVKAYAGENRNIGDRWERKGKHGWRKLTAHPGRQARRNARRLQEYLKGKGVDVAWVEPVVPGPERQAP